MRDEHTPAIGTREWWESQRRAAREITARALAAGASPLDADLAAVDYLTPMRLMGGDLGAGAALWISQCLWGAARNAAAEGHPADEVQWYRNEQLNALEDATRSGDPWIRDYAFNALVNELSDRSDGRRLSETVRRWREVAPERAGWRHLQQKAQAVVRPPLKDAEREALACALLRAGEVSKDPERPVMAGCGGPLTFAQMAAEVAAGTEIGNSIARMFALGRDEEPFASIVASLGMRRRPHLRRVPVAVRARGRAVSVAAISAADALDGWARQRFLAGEVYGWEQPGRSSADPRAAVLIVPENARAEAYPRSVNGVPIRLMRFAEGPRAAGPGD